MTFDAHLNPAGGGLVFHFCQVRNKVRGEEIPETAISRNRNGPRTRWVFKAHYREYRAMAELSRFHADPVSGHYAFLSVEYAIPLGCGSRRNRSQPAKFQCIQRILGKIVA